MLRAPLQASHLFAAVLAVAAGPLAGCAHEALSPRTTVAAERPAWAGAPAPSAPGPYTDPAWWPTPPAPEEDAVAIQQVSSDATPRPTGADASFAVLTLPPAAVAYRPTPVRRLVSATIPDGQGCLNELARLGVAFHTTEQLRGVTTPIVVNGPLNGISYRGLGGAQLICDCRLAVALHWIGDELRAAGVTEAWYSGAYAYRMARVGRLSLHAWGLAIDVHKMTLGGASLSLQADYERGTPELCASERPLNRVACRLKALGLFRELLTPDTDADHYDHFHLSIAPLGEDPVRRVAAPRTKPPATPAPSPSPVAHAPARPASHAQATPASHAPAAPASHAPATPASVTPATATTAPAVVAAHGGVGTSPPPSSDNRETPPKKAPAPARAARREEGNPVRPFPPRTRGQNPPIATHGSSGGAKPVAAGSAKPPHSPGTARSSPSKAK